MLKHLTISHYALIEHLDIDIASGFSVITGETGAGKSIMLGALNLLLGGRADAKAIQTGERKCMVEAAFNIEHAGLEPFFANNDIDFDPQECIVRREVMQSGKSRAFINDTPVTAAKLKEIGASLIDIHSQHQNLLLRNEHFLIDTLDIMAEQQDAVSAYKCLYGQCKHAEVALQQLQERAEKGKNDEDFLRYQLSQLEEASLTDNEQEDLEAEQDVLSHAEEIKQGLYNAQNMLATEDISVSHALRSAEDALYAISDKFTQAKELAERLKSVRIEVDDVESELEAAVGDVEYDPERLLFIEDRLSLIYNLEKKHNVSTIAELADITEKLRIELNAIDNLDDDLERQAIEVNRLKGLRDHSADMLTKARKKAALVIEKELTNALKELGMPNATMKMDITPRTEPDSTGADKVMFLFSANKNVPPQNVSDIASGGEIARLMLALKALIARRTALPTIVFDEIDTGVSGTMAESMARVMKQIAANCQVLCITHLPQIAALGTHHFKVYKEDSQDTTRSHIIPLTNNERIEEIAHMLSGAEITEAAIDNAKALLKTK